VDTEQQRAVGPTTFAQVGTGCGKVQVSIHGGCWLKLVADLKDCDKEAYVYKGSCYVPVIPPARPATSSPAACPDR
jgi:hypothetical protein